MSESAASTPEVSKKRSASPIDMARALKRLRGVDVAPVKPEAVVEDAAPKAGDIIERDGEQYMLAPVLRTVAEWKDGRQIFTQQPYTYRQYYAHTFEEPETGNRIPGPGWDSKFRLQDDELATIMHNRTFTKEELEELPNNLPETDCLFVSDLEGGRVEEYQHYLEQQK